LPVSFPVQIIYCIVEETAAFVQYELLIQLLMVAGLDSAEALQSNHRWMFSLLMDTQWCRCQFSQVCFVHTNDRTFVHWSTNVHCSSSSSSSKF